MKSIVIYNILLIIGFFLLTSRSCTPDWDIDEEVRSEPMQESSLREIKREFESEYLAEDNLFAYGEKARQKILDFADYLSLYSDKRIDTTFKWQIKETMYRLFYDDGAEIQLFKGPAGGTGNLPDNLENLLQNIDESEYQSISFKISDMEIIEPLHLQSLNRYTGKIGCTFKITGITERDTAVLYENPNQVNIVATLTSKKFGIDTSKIWQVFLDGIVTTD